MLRKNVPLIVLVSIVFALVYLVEDHPYVQHTGRAERLYEADCGFFDGGGQCSYVDLKVGNKTIAIKIEVSRYQSMKAGHCYEVDYQGSHIPFVVQSAVAFSIERPDACAE